MATRTTASCRADRHRLGGAGVGSAPANSDGQADDLFGAGGQTVQSYRRTRRRRRGREKSDRLRCALPPRDRQGGRTHRLSLGHHAQTRDARLGGGSGRRGSLTALMRNDFALNYHFALACYLSMIFSENRYPPFPDHAMAIDDVAAIRNTGRTSTKGV